MSEVWIPVIVALITSGLTLVGVIITSRKDKADMLAQIRQDSIVRDTEIKGQIDVIRQEIKDLTRQVEKHNQVIDRTYALESRIAAAEAKIEANRHE